MAEPEGVTSPTIVPPTEPPESVAPPQEALAAVSVVVMELPPNWEQSIAMRAQDNEYAQDPFAEVHGKSW